MKKEGHKSVFHRKGFVQLLWRLGFFGLFLIIEAYFIESRIKIPQKWWAAEFVMSTDFALSGILMAVGIFALLARNQLIHIKQQPKFNPAQFCAMFLINLLFAFFFTNLVKFMTVSQQSSLTLVLLWYVLGISMVASLFFAFFKVKDVVEFFNQPRTLVAGIIGVSFAFYYQLFKGFWHVLAYVVAKVVYFMLSLTYPNVTFSMNPDMTATIGTNAFNVIIAGACSGIDGVKLFLILFTFFLIIDWKAINPKKAVLLYFLGTVIMFTVNIIRVYLVLLIGNIVNPEFAMKGFHANIGWILFTFVFIIFEYLTYNWMRK